MSTESEEQARKILEAFGAAVNETDDVFKQMDKTLKRFNKDLKDIQPASKNFKDFMAGTKKPLEDLEDTARKFDKAMQKAIETGEDLRAAGIAEQKETTLKNVATSNARRGLSNFAIGLGGVTKTMLSGATEFVKGLQGTAEGTELTGQAALRAAEASGKLADSIGSVLDAFGMILAVLGPGKIWKGIGVGLSALGIGLETFGPALTEAATEGIKILNTEVENTKKTFRDITSTGAEFAGGMTEMREVMTNAGLDVTQLGTIVKSNTENLSNMGLGLTESIKRFSGINKELRNSQLGIQLRKLGLSTEEQGEMAIQTAAMLNASGRLRNMSDKEVAATTFQYAKDLKVLQNITGEDAKKKMEEARIRSLEADVFAQAMTEGGPAAVEKLQKQLATMPDVLKKGYLEFVSTGGQAVVDAATNVAMVNNPRIREQYQRQFDTLRNMNIDASAAQDETSKLTEQTAQFARDNAKLMQPIGTAARVFGDGLTQGATDIANGLILINTKYAEGVTETTRITVDAAANNKAALDENMAAIDETTQRLKAALGPALTGAITSYMDITKQTTISMSNFNDAIKNVNIATGITDPNEKTTMDAVKHILGEAFTWGTTGAVAGAVASPYVAGAGAVPGSIMGGVGGAVKGAVDVYQGNYAAGGIVHRPEIALIGEGSNSEAVVPLPDNKSIPVTMTGNSMDTKEITSAIYQQSNILNQILDSMQRNNQLTSGILQTSY
jgi:hypothetical protein